MAATTGCDSITGNDAPPLSFTYSEIQYTEEVGPKQIEIEGSQVYIHGKTASSCANQVPVAELDFEEPNLTLTIDDTDSEQCPTEARVFEYRARIGPLDPGSYRLRIRQENPGIFQMMTMADTTIAVGG